MIWANIVAFFAKWWIGLAGLAIALAATFYAGKMQERSGWESRRVEQVQAARSTERAGVDIANAAGSDHSAELKQQLEKANAELEKLRTALPTVGNCPVPRNVVSLLDGKRVPGAAGSPGKPKQPAAPVEDVPGDKAPGETVQCSAVIEHCAVNRVTVCEPNALQVEALQRFYENLKRKYNGALQ